MKLFDHQKNFLDSAPSLAFPQRACLYYKTGAGKSLTAVLGVKELGWEQAMVIAPPSTHADWVALGWAQDVAIEVMSHAKFRMEDTKLSRKIPVIADEFHQFGGQQGKGWKKLDTLARHLQAPLFLLSATPNYNDAERVYCVQHILDPLSCKGGFLQFLYQHCDTEQDPFSMVPKVLGFKNHTSAADYLAALPNVYHLPDDLVYDIEDIEYGVALDPGLELGYDKRNHRMIASIMERRHTERYQGLVDDNGYIDVDVYDQIKKILDDDLPVLIFSNHATIAEALSKTFGWDKRKHVIVTGQTSKQEKARLLAEFRAGAHDILIGTATLATGTDGMDRVCDTLVILDDTDDDALRRQLIGRIMPRGDFGDASTKKVYRFIPN